MFSFSGSTSSQSLQFYVRLNEARGGADKGWLKTFHSFSTDMYPQKEFSSWGALKVLNEDRVEPYKGFGEHGHQEFEIFSYIVSGKLEHQDSMGNVEILKRGDIQLTSAGTGIRHSEKAHGGTQVHFLQIWTTPLAGGLAPKYYTRHFTDEEKMNRWTCVVAPVGSIGVSDERTGAGPTPVRSPISLYATLLGPARSSKYIMIADVRPSVERKVYIHVIQTSDYNPGKSDGAHIKVGGEIELREGDGVMIAGHQLAEVSVTNIGDLVAEVLLFEVV